MSDIKHMNFQTANIPSSPLYSAKSYKAEPFDKVGRKDKGKKTAKAIIDSYAWGRILIITGYSDQKRILEEKIAELPPQEVPPGLISIRTSDDSPSYEAEVVVCDLVRTEKAGFLVEDERLVVMTTRAQPLLYTAGSKS
ncbi:uncharacterized protein TrAFT101_001113 [Trichoderma asperellum]|uniref:uncharacterized protein n=1 Tax=Trichoderma asperellum TaxID=101201 RepID=UPI00332F18A8|nr:hypothetical protein TrAFT101_001113 [Trichoderma asperellum]